MIFIALLFACATAPAPKSERCAGAAVVEPPKVALPGFIKQNHARRVIIFVHGLAGDGHGSWTAENKAYWPAIVAADPQLAGFDVYVYQYDTNPFNSCMSIEDLRVQARRRLIDDGLTRDYDEIVWVAHSMGGIVTREVILLEPELANKTRMIYLFGTPTNGAEKADLLAPFLRRCQQVQDLRTIDVNTFLQHMQNEWITRVKSNTKLTTRCAFEVPSDTVERGSATALCDTLPEPIHRSHTDLVKPLCASDDPHVALRNALIEQFAPPTASVTARPKRLVITPLSKATNVLDVAMASDGTVVYLTDDGLGKSTVWRTDLHGVEPVAIAHPDGSGDVELSSRGDVVYTYGGGSTEHSGVAMMNLQGGAPRDIVHQFYFQAILDPAGRQLLVVPANASDVAVRDLASSVERVIFSSKREAPLSAAWHPDGRHVTVVGNNLLPRTVDVDSREMTTPPFPAGVFRALAWNAPGDYLLARGVVNGTFEWLRVDADGSEILTATDDDGAIVRLDPTPRPNVFTAVVRTLKTELHVAALDRRGYSVLGQLASGSDIYWTRDGLLTYRNGRGQRLWIEERDMHAQDARRLSDDSSFVEVAVSPDGRNVYGASWVPGKEALVRIDRTTLAQETIDARTVSEIALSPDGRWLAYSVIRSDTRPVGIYVVAVGGKSSKLIARHSPSHLAFTQDSTHLVWTTISGDARVWIAPADGKEQPRAVSEQQSYMYSLVPGGFDMMIVHSSYGPNGFTGPIVDWRTGAVKDEVRLPSGPWSEPVWSSDGQRVYAAMLSGGGVVEFDRQTGTSRYIVPAGTECYSVAISPDDKFLAYEQRSETREAVLINAVP